MTLKNKVIVFFARCIGVIATSILLTPIFTGFSGVIINVYLYFRYSHNFNIWDEFLFFASKGVALGVIIGISGCIIFLFRGSRA